MREPSKIPYRKYGEMIQEIHDRKRTVLNVDLDDIRAKLDEEFLVSVEGNAMRYLKLFYEAVDGILKNFKNVRGVLEEDDDVDLVQKHQRQAKYEEIKRREQGEDAPVGGPELPPELQRKYELRLVPRTRDTPPLQLREVSGSSLGHLVQVKAMVLRATDVKPQITVATHSCDRCGYENYQTINDSKAFLPQQLCVSEVCKTNGWGGKLNMHVGRSAWVKYQELRVQELPEHVPAGSVPRTMTVVCRGAATREAKAGDQVLVGGIFLPTPFTGMQVLKAGGLTTKTYLLAQHLVCLKKGETDGLSDEAAQAIEEVSKQDAYSLLARSIAPEIFGLEDVKKCLLLQLVGGVTRQQGDGMKTRGDINVCLMGDPGVAKSQLLKHISKIAPRCVYTTGKGSSGVGLTAAVVREPMTNELTLEGGALVLADMGICCIDEFDKMEEADRTAIHEVMEQQTVSIAKAGITTTLNARTAILAAANPKFGRYNRMADRDAHEALQKNINLPAALLSRFDLMFLLLDETDRDNDLGLAEHITYVHQHEKHPPLGFKPYDPVFLRQYINVARCVRSVCASCCCAALLALSYSRVSHPPPSPYPPPTHTHFFSSPLVSPPNCVIT